MPIEIITEKISSEKLHSFLGHPFSDMVKFVVDIEKEILALGGEMHADAEEILLENGSEQKNVWGGNVYPLNQENKIEYTSLINIRPAQGNRTLEVQDTGIRERMLAVVKKFIPI